MNTLKKQINVPLLMESERCLEGIVVIIGSLADSGDNPELEVVHDLLINAIEGMRTALDVDGEDLG